jgi:hypothetical protein
MTIAMDTPKRSPKDSPQAAPAPVRMLTRSRPNQTDIQADQNNPKDVPAPIPRPRKVGHRRPPAEVSGNGPSPTRLDGAA